MPGDIGIFGIFRFFWYIAKKKQKSKKQKPAGLYDLQWVVFFVCFSVFFWGWMFVLCIFDSLLLGGIFGIFVRFVKHLLFVRSFGTSKYAKNTANISI